MEKALTFIFFIILQFTSTLFINQVKSGNQEDTQCNQNKIEYVNNLNDNFKNEVVKEEKVIYPICRSF